MTKRTLPRLVTALAAAGLVLTACGSTAAEPSAAPSAATTMAEGSEMSQEMSEGSSGTSEENAEESMAPSDAAEQAQASGSYITLTQYEGGKDMYDGGNVVLFFAADWCPTCQEATENLEADPAAIPAGLTIVRVDYDNADELKQKYGVTTQHTFVQVDGSGQELAKWTGSVTADEIQKQTI